MLKFIIYVKWIINIVVFYYNFLLSFFFKKENNIDVVYLWVDGDDPVLKDKKEKILASNKINSEEYERKSIMNYRWKNNNEIILSLKSVEKYCLWISKIWIITDNQTPDFAGLSENIRNRIKIVDHKEIFKGYENNLPTFNSRTIETLLWRINGLSENFIFFNDDMFVLQNLSKRDFFMFNKLVIRGYYRVFNKRKKQNMHTEGMINSASIIGYNEIFFKSAHCPYTMKKSPIEKLFTLYKNQFEKNIQYRIRNRDQFKIVSLLYHFLLKDNNCLIKPGNDYIHMSQHVCNSYTREKLISILQKIKSGKYKFLCINDVSALAEKVPEYKSYFPEEIAE